MKIELTEFGGMAPSIEPRVLSDKLAADAYNAGFDSGTLGESLMSTVASEAFFNLSPLCQSILRPGNSETRLQFTTTTTRGVAFASLLSVRDKWGRVYFSTPSGPRYTVSDNYTAGSLTLNPVSYKLGIPAPAYQPTAGTPAVTAQDGITADNVMVAYVFTYVDQFGHEGPPSPPSTKVWLPTNLAFSCRLSFVAGSLPEFPTTNAVRRVYRATFDGSTSDWQFVGDVALATTSWSDTVPVGGEGEALVSTNWAPPPDGMQSMVPVASNFVAGFKDHYLCYSESLLPHAWPESYRFPLKYKIVGLAATQNGLLVATTGKPYWCMGADPASAVPVELDANHPCLSALSIVDMGGFVVYASYDGLVAVAGNDVKVLTTAFINRRTWLSSFAPTKIVAFAHEGRYVFSVGSDWWMFDPADQGGGFMKLGLTTVLPSALQQAYYDAYRDTVVLLDKQGRAFDVVSAPSGAFRWRSKIFTTPALSFAVAQVQASAYPVTLTVFSGDTARSYIATSERPFRLAGGLRTPNWQFELAAGSGVRVTSMAVAQSAQELL